MSLLSAPDDSFLEALRGLVGERMSTAPAILEGHGKDESYRPSIPPDAVVFATSTEEVAEVVKLCAAHRVAVIAYGAGTSLEGNVAALEGGVCIDLSGMNEVLEINAADLDCRVQAGVTRRQLNTELRDTGLFFPVDPGADASIGGMTATRASGTSAVRYGTMRENVLSLTVVLADGRVIRTARRARKSAAGYDLTRLFVGSEGTLGVITEIGLRLYGIPETVLAAVCSFDELSAAIDTVILTMQSGIPIARIELLDEVQIDAINRYSGLDFAVAPTLFLEFNGSVASVDEQLAAVKAIATDLGGGEFAIAAETEARAKLWRARHDAAYACKALRPGTGIWATDVCVPISRLAECILETKRDIEASGVIAPIVGHVGDGNFHLVILADQNDADERARAEALHERMVMRALAMEGTCTGEHGVGYSKLDFLQAEHGEAIGVMRQLKLALDPDNIMNPGKVLRV